MAALPRFVHVAFIGLLPAIAFHVPPLYSSVWPQPLSVQYASSYTMSVDNSFSISCSSTVCPAPLADAITRYTSYILFAGAPDMRAAEVPYLSSLVISVQSDAQLEIGVDESYNLTVSAGGAFLSAVTQWGALRGLESFSQLCVWQGPDVPTAYTVTNAPVTISDSPRFAARGVLIDTSFNFLTTDAIRQVPGARARVICRHRYLLTRPS
jgi:hexosaminidase